MESITSNASYELTLDTLSIPERGKYPIFFTGLLIYLFSSSCNLTLMVLIIVEQSLHKPMYFILFSLPLNDMIGISAMLPKVLSGIVMETSKTYYPLCVLQGFLLHMYGGGVLFVLAAMAYDRYVAICHPLRYSAIMTPTTIVVIISLVWGFDFILIISLFYIQIRLPRCRSAIANVYCDNMSLLKLTCVNITANSILGLVITALMQTVSVSIQLFSYVKILTVCLSNRRSGTKTKAINTCVVQLVIFSIFEFVGTFTILSQRFKDVSVDLQKVTGMLIFLVSPLLNPIVYGLNTSEIRNALFKVFRTKVSWKSCPHPQGY